MDFNPISYLLVCCFCQTTWPSSRTTPQRRMAWQMCHMKARSLPMSRSCMSWQFTCRSLWFALLWGWQYHTYDGNWEDSSLKAISKIWLGTSMTEFPAPRKPDPKSQIIWGQSRFAPGHGDLSWCCWEGPKFALQSVCTWQWTHLPGEPQKGHKGQGWDCFKVKLPPC